MAAGISPPPGYAPGQTRVPIILGFMYPLLVLKVVLAAMRFYVRYYMLHSIGVDDWLLFGAVLTSLAHSFTGLWAVSKGLGRHDYDLFMEGRNPYKDLVPLSYLGPLTYNLGMLLTQLSILALYMRLSLSKLGRVVIIVVTGFATLNTVSGVVVNFILKHRSPVERDRGLAILWYVNCGLGLPIDFALWSIPIPMVLKLDKLDRRKKIGLILTFSLGLMGCVTALVRLCLIRQAASFQGDLAWKSSYITVLTTAELGFGICAVCMAGLRPLFVRFLNWYDGTPGSGASMSRTKCSRVLGSGNTKVTQGHTNQISKGSMRLTTESASDYTEPGTEPTRRNLNLMKAGSKVTTCHTDIELGNITAISTDDTRAESTRPPPLPVVSGADGRSTRTSGILRTLTATNSHISRHDRDRNNIHTESTTSLTGEAHDQYDQLHTESGVA